MSLTPFRGRCHTCGIDHDRLPQPLEYVRDLDSQAAQIAALETEMAVWIRRADKTWHEKHFTDQIAALTAERDALRDALRFHVMRNVLHKGTCRYFDTANSCSCGVADKAVINILAARTPAPTKENPNAQG